MSLAVVVLPTDHLQTLWPETGTGLADSSNPSVASVHRWHCLCHPHAYVHPREGAASKVRGRSLAASPWHVFPTNGAHLTVCRGNLKSALSCLDNVSFFGGPRQKGQQPGGGAAAAPAGPLDDVTNNQVVHGPRTPAVAPHSPCQGDGWRERQPAGGAADVGFDLPPSTPGNATREAPAAPRPRLRPAAVVSRSPALVAIAPPPGISSPQKILQPDRPSARRTRMATEQVHCGIVEAGEGAVVPGPVAGRRGAITKSPTIVGLDVLASPATPAAARPRRQLPVSRRQGPVGGDPAAVPAACGDGHTPHHTPPPPARPSPGPGPGLHTIPEQQTWRFEELGEQGVHRCNEERRALAGQQVQAAARQQAHAAPRRQVQAGASHSAVDRLPQALAQVHSPGTPASVGGARAGGDSFDDMLDVFQNQVRCNGLEPPRRLSIPAFVPGAAYFSSQHPHTPCCQHAHTLSHPISACTLTPHISQHAHLSLQPISASMLTSTLVAADELHGPQWEGKVLQAEPTASSSSSLPAAAAGNCSLPEGATAAGARSLPAAAAAGPTRSSCSP